ncbi:hypothetical protein CCACVL1_24301 [Corchorus capsularis]|uniref:Uncharacterized protein n=1 Tax=Corchorus capsularis TaxID=210143 RepID=A0A1R3GQC8_COCAP|nr:hypothetical protein CCACVL1_24301 [Corchorus capsularis]
MESGQMSKKDDLKVDIPSETEMMSSVGVESHHQAAAAISGQMGVSSGSGLSRQTSITKTNNCLCSPTTHVGSFRCRLHRAPSLQRTKSIDSKPNSATATFH